MKSEPDSIPRELGIQLDQLGRERGGVVVCIAMVTEDDIQLIYPGLASAEVVALVEEAVIGALIGTMGE